MVPAPVGAPKHLSGLARRNIDADGQSGPVTDPGDKRQATIVKCGLRGN